MIIAGIINLYALVLAAGFGLLVAAVYAVFIMKKSSLESQAKNMGLALGSGSPALRGYHGLYRRFYIGIEPAVGIGGLVISLAHPDQDRILEKPLIHHGAVTELQVNDNVLTFTISCKSPSKPGVQLQKLIDTAINAL